MVFKDLNRFLTLLILGVLFSFPVWGNLNFIKDNSLFQTPADIQAIKVLPTSDTQERWKKVIGKQQSWN